MPKFELGQTVMTPGVEALLFSGADLSVYLSRHASGDYGDVDAEDKAANDAAILDEARILSAYTTLNGVKIWIITEADRSVTTLLLPDEY